MSREEQDAVIKENPKYGNIICRCETITEGEIMDAIHRPLGARSMDAVKRRVRAGMGRCQGGFCGPKVIEILAREWKIPVDQVIDAMKEVGDRMDVSLKETGVGGVAGSPVGQEVVKRLFG